MIPVRGAQAASLLGLAASRNELCLNRWPTSFTTPHMLRNAHERRFTVEQAMLTIDKPARILKTPPRRGNHGGTIWLFFRAFGNRILVAVAEVKNNECWIITAYWEEGR